MRGGRPVNADRAEVLHRKQRRREPGECGTVLEAAAARLKEVPSHIFSQSVLRVVWSPSVGEARLFVSGGTLTGRVIQCTGWWEECESVFLSPALLYAVCAFTAHPK